MLVSAFVTLAASLAFANAQQSAAAGDLMINTPTSAAACLPIQITWQGGSPPYYVSLIAPGQPGSAALKDFGQQTDTKLVWTVDAAAGSSYTVQIRDSTGKINYSDKFTIQPSSQTCTTSTPSEGGSAAPAASPSSTSSQGSAASNTSSATPSASAGKNTTSSTSSTSTGGATSSTSAKPATTASTSSSTAPSSASNTTAAGNQARTSDALRLKCGFTAFGLSLLVVLFA